jgi:hypothetical protein
MQGFKRLPKDRKLSINLTHETSSFRFFGAETSYVSGKRPIHRVRLH